MDGRLIKTDFKNNRSPAEKVKGTSFTRSRLNDILYPELNSPNQDLTNLPKHSPERMQISGNKRLNNARIIIDEWKRKHAFNFTFRSNLKQFISFDDNGLRLGKIYIDFTGIQESDIQATLESGNLIVPSRSDIDEMISIMPGEDIHERRLNFAKLLGFSKEDINSSFKIWTSTEVEFDYADDKGTKSIQSKYFKLIIDVFMKKAKYYSVLFYSKGDSTYFNAREDEPAYVLPIKKIK